MKYMNEAEFNEANVFGKGQANTGNMEKIGSLGTSLPRNDEQITTEPGDLILY